MSDESERLQGEYIGGGGMSIQGAHFWPGGIDTSGLLPEPTLEGTSLSDEQDARVTALHHARGVLESTGGPFGSGTGTRPPRVEDLLTVARWILDGDDSDQDR